MRVQITKMPLGKAAYGKQVDGSLSLQPGAFGGGDYKASDKANYKGVKQTVDEVSREEANLEAEGGETAFGPISGQSIPDHLKIRGKRHHEGGVPLNLPDDTFIFSDTASLRINDPSVLAMFNKVPKKGGYTPAEIAKPYNINKYKAILLDPESGKLERDTATIMIKNYIMKLGALALVQESMKGFPQGVPEMAKPYMEANGISEEDLMPELKEQADALAQAMGSGEQTGMPQEQNPMMAQEMQQMAPEQAMQAQQAMMAQGQPQPSYPQQMPSGAPVASPDMMAQMQGSMPPPDMMAQQAMSPQPGMMAYGGMPYAAYGMEMGGYDFPYYPNEMAYGGVPRFDNGGDTRPGTTRKVSPEEYASSTWETRRDDQGEYKYNRRTGEVIGKADVQTKSQREASGRGVRGGGGYTKEDVCSWMKKVGGNYYGWTAEEIIAAGIAAPSALGFLKGCEVKGETVEEEAIFTEATPTEDCLCKNPDGTVYKDSNGNTKIAPKDPETGECLVNDASCGTITETESLLCRCTDPVTGQVTEYAIENEADCICQDGSQGQLSQGMATAATPHWSRAARTNVMRNALVATKPAPSNVVLPGRSQVKGAYEEYQTKVDTAQAAINSLQNAVMTGMAGSSSSKQAQMKDLLGKSLRASMDAVADVQSRNVDRQRETNVQTATIDNANMLARAQAMQGALDTQKLNRDQETANKNLRRYNTMGAMMDADKEMAARQNMNILTPQYASEYEYGFIAPTGVEKPLTGATSATLEDRIQYYLGKTGDYQQAFDMAYKESRLNKSMYGGQRMANGGYVFATNAYPFII